MSEGADRYAGFPEGFFDRADPDDATFYAPARLVTHLDEAAIAQVGALYDELGLGQGQVLDLMSSWVSHFAEAPAELVALGMNPQELAANPQATSWVAHDLNAEPRLPFDDARFDAVVCCVSVDYLVRPLEVFDEVARVLRPGGPFVCTFSNRCFPTKAIRGWLASDDGTHVGLVGEYFRRSGPWGEPEAQHRNRGRPGDPLFAVWAERA